MRRTARQRVKKNSAFQFVRIHFRLSAADAAGVLPARPVGEAACGDCLAGAGVVVLLWMVESALSGPAYLFDSAQFPVGWMARAYGGASGWVSKIGTRAGCRRKSRQYRVLQIRELLYRQCERCRWDRLSPGNNYPAACYLVLHLPADHLPDRFLPGPDDRKQFP